MFSRLMVLLSIYVFFVPVLLAQTAINAPSVNGVVNPLFSSGADLGAQVNNAFASLGGPGIVRIPRNSYTGDPNSLTSNGYRYFYSTTIVIPAGGYRLECDPGTTLAYQGSGDAIDIAGGNSGIKRNTVSSRLCELLYV